MPNGAPLLSILCRHMLLSDRNSNPSSMPVGQPIKQRNKSQDYCLTDLHLYFYFFLNPPLVLFQVGGLYYRYAVCW